MPDVLRSILDTHPDIICRYDTQYNVTYANLAAARFFGLEQDSLIGKNVVKASSRFDPNTRLDVLHRISEDNPKSTDIEKMPDGSLFEYVCWTTIGIFEDGELVEYQTTGRDITESQKLGRELKRKSESLAQARAELRTVLDTVPARIWYKDDQNNILHLNQAAAESMNMSVSDVQGRNTYDLFGPAAKSYHEDDLKVIRSGKPLRGHIEPYTPEEGIQGWVQTDKIPLTDGHQEPRILVVSTDISALKDQEAILQSVNKNLNDFASMVSHDLQAPLRKIGLTVELMDLELGDEVPESFRPYMSDITDGVRGMRELIQSFLKFMRSSPESIELRPVPINDVLADAIEVFKDEIEETNARITLPQTQRFVRGDRALLKQVFQNLISNAIKYRSPNRPLKIDISIEENKQFWSIFVKDNGTGIDPHFASQIFDVFGRGKPERGVEGAGIGLALCRRIVTLHGGTIDLTRQNGHGASFKVDLYRARGT